jgi:hypothetical protein
MKKLVFPIIILLLGFLSFSCENDSESSLNNINNNIDGGNDADVSDVIEDATDASVNDTDPRLAENIFVNHVTLFQTVEIDIIQDKQIVSNLNSPIISNRESLFVLYCNVGDGWVSKEIEGILKIENNGITNQYKLKKFITQSQVKNSFETAFTFSVPGEFITTSTTYGFELVDENAEPVLDETSHPGKYPENGSLLNLPVQNDDGGVKIVIVPVIYNIDGSGRLPDLSATQVEIYKELLRSIYPLYNLDFTIRTAIEWPQPGDNPSSYDFGDMNLFLRQLKADDGAAQDVYYYALVRPDETFADYCSGTCTTGQSYVVSSPDSGSYRVGNGVGFTGIRWAWTLVHELGHMHGRKHAPCDTFSGLDFSYPYSSGKIGVWGYDFAENSTFFDPDIARDFMGYCDNRWVSDYNYRGLFERIIAVNSLSKKKSFKIIYPVKFISIEPDNTIKRSRDGFSEISSFPENELVKVDYVDISGNIVKSLKLPVIKESHTKTVTIPIVKIITPFFYVKFSIGNETIFIETPWETLF